MKPVCKRCGKCCVIFNPISKKWQKCTYLSNDNLCRVYASRINRYLGFGYTCNYRDKINYDFPDCPFNQGKPLHPLYNK